MCLAKRNVSLLYYFFKKKIKKFTDTRLLNGSLFLNIQNHIIISAGTVSLRQLPMSNIDSLMSDQRKWKRHHISSSKDIRNVGFHELKNTDVIKTTLFVK